MLNKIFRPWIWPALAMLAVYALQWFPGTGIVLMMLGAAAWCGVLLHVTMILLVLDCRADKSPKFLLAAPIAFYALGFGAFVLSTFDAFTLSRHVAAMSAGQPVAFDPARDAIYADRSAEPVLRTLQSQYELNVAYVHGRNASRVVAAQRLVTTEECRRRRQHRDVDVSWFHLEGHYFVKNACLLRAPERIETPSMMILRSTTSRERWGWENAEITRTDLDHNGVALSVATARTYVYPPIPFVIAGCALNSGAGRWDCIIQPTKIPVQVGGARRPDEGAQAGVIADLLGIAPRRFINRRRALLNNSVEMVFTDPDAR